MCFWTPTFNIYPFTADPIKAGFTLPYWSKLSFLIFDIRALWQLSKIKNGGLDQYGTGPIKRQQFGTAGIEGVKYLN